MRARIIGMVGWLSARPWIAAVAFVLLAAFLVTRTNHYASLADRWVDGEVYARVNFWIASSECTARSGVILGHCLENGRVEGIENASLADDRGHTVIANLYALYTGKAITLRGLVVANIVINAFALFAIGVTLFLCGWKLSALLLLMAPRYVVPGPLPSPDSYATHVAAFLFALVAAVLIAHIPLRARDTSKVHWLAIAALAAVCLGWSTLLRQPYGYAGFLVSVLVLVLRWLREARAGVRLGEQGMSLRAGVVTVTLAVATFYGTTALFALRGAMFDVPRSNTAIESHGISHNLYLGLGVPGNPWGIKWDDSAALAHIGEADRVRYGSEDHYRSLRKSYLRIVTTEPLAVAKIYGEKLADSILEVTQSDTPVRTAVVWATVLVLLLAWLAKSQSRLSSSELGTLVAVWASFSMVVLQGVLALPEHQFISPGKYAAICAFVVLAECIARQLFQPRLPIPA